VWAAANGALLEWKKRRGDRHALRRKLGRRENRLSPSPSGPSKSARNLAELGRGRAPNLGFAV